MTISAFIAIATLPNLFACFVFTLLIWFLKQVNANMTRAALFYISSAVQTLQPSRGPRCTD